MEMMKEEMAKIKAEMDMKVANSDFPEAVAEAVRDLPYEMISVYKYEWTTPNATITFDHFIADYNNADRPGGGDGVLDLATGTFTCITPGYYTISFSGHSELNPGDENWIFLHINGEKMEESAYVDHDNKDAIGSRIDTRGDNQGSHSLVGP